MKMAELSGSMQLPGKSGGSVSDAPSKQFRPWLQQVSPASNGILHIPTNMLSQRTLHSLMQGKRSTQQTESVVQPATGRHVVSKKQNVPPRGGTKTNEVLNESVRSKMRESLAAALVLVQRDDESPKGVEETRGVSLENTEGFQPVLHEGVGVPVGEGATAELGTGVESSVQKDSEISVEVRMEDVIQSDELKSQYDEVFPPDDVFSDIIFPNDDLLQGNELSWVLGHVSDFEVTKDHETKCEKSVQDPELLASKIEMEMFKLFGGVNKKYREKGRSLLFNLKDKNNPELRERVISEDISAERLCSMTADELASKELTEWRQAKAEKMAEMVVLQDTNIDVRRLVRKTHKGEFQVEMEPVDNGMADISAGITSRSRRRPKPKSNAAKTILKDNPADADQTISTEEIDPMQGLAMDDELKDVGFLPPIVSLDEFMESLDAEPPFESPHGNSEMQATVSEKSVSEVGSQSKSPKESSPKESPKEPLKEVSEKGSPTTTPEKIEEVSPKSDASAKIDDDVSKLEKNSLGDDVNADVKGERVWDGILQLSMSSVVPVTGICKSGEKADTSEWPAMVEVKGRVRLSAFGKFIQELPKSRSRAIMVMYLACKEGISKSQRGSLFEVVESYVADQRVGYAEPASGVELYLCPTRGEVLDLLTKVISKERLDEAKTLDIGLIGVAVWRRAVVPKPVLKRHYSSGSRANVLPENKKPRVNVTEKPRVVAPMKNNHYGYGVKSVVQEDDVDDLPPGFGPRDDDDLPEFNFSSSVAPVALPAKSKSIDQVRKLIHMYGKSASTYNNDVDEDDILPEWKPNSQQLPPPPPPPSGFIPEMARPTQDEWWNGQSSGSGQQYDQNRSRNRGY